MFVAKIKARSGLEITHGEKKIYIKNLDNKGTIIGVNADDDVGILRIDKDHEGINESSGNK